MPDLTFNQDDRASFPTKHHGEVSLSKGKWDSICQAPERFFYRENAEKIATTLVAPDNVRQSKQNDDAYIYYKEFGAVVISGNEIKCHVKYWAVVIDKCSGKVCTVYPAAKMKQGKEHK